MQSPLSRYTTIARRWAWMILLGMVICGGGTYIVSKLMRPVYQASASIILMMGSSNTSPYDSTSASLAALPTYASLITNPVVLNPVLAQHKGLTIDQLNNMLSVKPQSNTQVIEIDVKNTNPQLATQIANDVSHSFENYVNSQLPAAVTVLPAQLPTIPVSPKPLPNAALGALVGLGLAIALIIIFEWIDDRPSSPEEIQELLGMDILVNLPRLSRKEYTKPIEEIPALEEGCRKLCAILNVAQRNNPFKLLMITSARAEEGKSSIASDLAASLAMTGKRTLLVDTNLQSSVLDQHFDIKTPTELANGLVVTWHEIEEHLNGQPTTIPNLFIVTAGVLDVHVLPGEAFASSSIDLLESPWVDKLFEHFKKAPFDYVIFDAPPLLSAAETQILASYVHTALVVVDASKTPRQALLQAKRALQRTHTRTLGVILNKSLWPSRADSHSGGRHWNRSRRTYSSSKLLSPEIPFKGNGYELSNGSVDSNMTVTLPRRRTSDNEKM